MQSSRPIVDGFILSAAVIANAAVLYFLSDSILRLSLGLLLLGLIVCASARLGVVELLSRLPGDKVYKRRFVMLRSLVRQLLGEIRRLNWMAVDAARGFRSPEAAVREMDLIEQRLKELIHQIRSSAGRPSTGNVIGTSPNCRSPGDTRGTPPREPLRRMGFRGRAGPPVPRARSASHVRLGRVSRRGRPTWF